MKLLQQELKNLTFTRNSIKENKIKYFIIIVLLYCYKIDDLLNHFNK